MSTLTPAYLHHVQARLVARCQDIDARLHAAVVTATREPSQVTEVRDFKDAAAREWDAALDEAGLAQAARERGELLAALCRIREGTYGDCLECGRPIPVHRIEALPTAALCAECQRLRERHDVHRTARAAGG
ncbi:MAG: hypothetical protein HOQ10_12780 [Frateuria sp.]|nr:hypothetical protein [Frateuria sp.]